MTSRKIVLTFPQKLVDQPIVYKLIKDFNLVFNILKASIKPDEEGLMVLELTGENVEIEKGIKYLKDQGVAIQPLSKDIVVNWETCVQCGACVALCPTGALYVKNRQTMEVAFDSEKCIACELCIKPCPPRAISARY